MLDHHCLCIYFFVLGFFSTWVDSIERIVKEFRELSQSNKGGGGEFKYHF